MIQLFSRKVPKKVIQGMTKMVTFHLIKKINNKKIKNLPDQVVDRRVSISFSASLRPPSLSLNQFSLIHRSVDRYRLVWTNDSIRTGTSTIPKL